MKIGTRSLLFGAHQFIIHPFFTTWAWFKLYGRPSFKELVCIVVHDWGYWGCADLDGPEGDPHPITGARIAGGFFDKRHDFREGSYYALCLAHSRGFAKKIGLAPSRLCFADKLSFCLMPAWLYLPMVRATGELKEYMQHAQDRAGAGEPMTVRADSELNWFYDVRAYLLKWISAHKDGRPDTWTPAQKEAVSHSGVWK